MAFNLMSPDQDVTDTEVHDDVLKVSPDRVADIYEKVCVTNQLKSYLGSLNTQNNIKDQICNYFS
jgi:hypothetical protein